MSFLSLRRKRQHLLFDISKIVQQLALSFLTFLAMAKLSKRELNMAISKSVVFLCFVAGPDDFSDHLGLRANLPRFHQRQREEHR